MKPVLQSRWKVEGNRLVYYGLRKSPDTFMRSVRISGRTRRALESASECKRPSGQLRRLMRKGIVVDESEKRIEPASLEEALYCKNCVANDYMIPGLELDENGLCPLCATKEETAKYTSILPVVKDIPRNKKSKYDVALFYTGGKDSSFLLYYLAVVKKLRVLALTWKIPFMSKTALQSIENAQKRLPQVTFRCEEAPDELLYRFYKKLYEIQGNVCACPSIAYLMFFEQLVDDDVRYLVLGNEPVQIKNLLYNGMAPKIAFSYAHSPVLNFLLNIPRLLSLKRPFSPGQLQMRAAVSQLVYGDSFVKRISGYRNRLIEAYRIALEDVPELCTSARRALKKSSRNARLPRLVHIDMNDISESGVYVWSDIKQLLSDQLGWVEAAADKGLHTSCSLERCKEHSQLEAFRSMKNPTIPFSSIELSLAVSSGSVSREDAMRELREHTGFCSCPVEQYATISDYFSSHEKAQDSTQG